MNTIKKPDLNAPRFRKQTLTTLNKDVIAQLRQKVKGLEKFTDNDLKNIIVTFNKNLWETVIEKRDGVELPSQIGHVFIGTCPPSTTKKQLNMKMSIEHLVEIKHRNWESDQHLAKIFFTTFANKYKYKNHEIWAFNACRDFSRSVSKNYPEKWKQYLVVDPGIKISNTFKNSSYKMDCREREKGELKEYNEFEF